MNKYTDILKAYQGELVERVKLLIEDHSDTWELEDKSLLINVLDDKSLTADDIVEALYSIKEMEESTNRDFKQAILVMELAIKRSHQKTVDIDVKDYITGESEKGFSGRFNATRQGGLSQGLTSLV